MPDQDLSDFKSFSGFIKLNDEDSMPLIFKCRIDQSGGVQFDFGKIDLTDKTSFLMRCWGVEGEKFRTFSLCGRSNDGTEFKTDDLIIHSLSHALDVENGSSISPTGRCSRATFHRKLVVLAQKPVLRMRLKGFRNFRSLSTTCRLGPITMDGPPELADVDTITGSLSVQSEDDAVDSSTWRSEAYQVLEHVQRVMSFASSTVLRVPIIEFFSGDEMEVIALSQIRQAPAPMPTFDHLHLQRIFDAAVSSFFDPPFKVKNLFFAIEWFAMDSTYNEARLINAMTVLENLVAANLENSDVFIRPVKEFDKVRKNIRAVLRNDIQKWSLNEVEAGVVLKDFNEKLGDLNRRSILQKLNILAERWAVPLDGIGEEEIKAAKKARDYIVHRGHYYEIDGESRDDLWRHVTIVREIVVRFLFRAIDYQGHYISYVGGSHWANFPPKIEISNERPTQN